jgi:hypothetical protein
MAVEFKIIWVTQQYKSAIRCNIQVATSILVCVFGILLCIYTINVRSCFSESLGFWTLSIVRNSKYKKTQRFGNRICFRQVKQIQFPKRCVFLYLELQTMDKVQKPNNSERYTPSLESFRLCLLLTESWAKRLQKLIFYVFSLDPLKTPTKLHYLYKSTCLNTTLFIIILLFNHNNYIVTIKS